MGVMAAALSESGVIGIVGPVEVGDAKLYVDGFKAGAEANGSGVTVNVNYTGSFSDVALASEAAQAQISAGADVLTGTAQMVVGAVSVASDEGIPWFGTQANQSSLGDIVVASQVYKWEVVLRDIIDKIGQAGARRHHLRDQPRERWRGHRVQPELRPARRHPSARRRHRRRDHRRIDHDRAVGKIDGPGGSPPAPREPSYGGEHGRHPDARDAGNHQTIPRRARQRPRRLRCRRRRSAHPARRERRRQEHADEDPLRDVPGRRRRDPAQRRAGRASRRRRLRSPTTSG